MQYISVRSIASQLKDQFHIDLEIFQVVTSCRDALKKMGMIALSRSIILGRIDNFAINLPGSVWKVRGVIRLDRLPENSMNVEFQDIYFPPQIVFTTAETEPLTTQPTLFKSNYVPQIKGPYIDFTWKKPLLKFNETGVPIAVEVTGLTLDEEGFPMLPEAAFFGCLYYTLFVYYQPLYLQKKVDPEIFKTITQWKKDNMAQSETALMMESLNSNERDKLFDIMTSYDRKKYGVSS